jgi:hypothetical protein
MAKDSSKKRAKAKSAPTVKAWHAYQEEAAKFFRGLGLTAETNKPIKGARGKHNMGVWVTGTIFGVAVKWAVECKACARISPRKTPSRPSRSSATSVLIEGFCSLRRGFSQARFGSCDGPTSC